MDEVGDALVPGKRSKWHVLSDHRQGSVKTVEVAIEGGWVCCAWITSARRAENKSCVARGSLADVLHRLADGLTWRRKLHDA